MKMMLLKGHYANLFLQVTQLTYSYKYGLLSLISSSLVQKEFSQHHCVECPCALPFWLFSLVSMLLIFSSILLFLSLLNFCFCVKRDLEFRATFVYHVSSEILLERYTNTVLGPGQSLEEGQ